jgi:hypothetical protein
VKIDGISSPYENLSPYPQHPHISSLTITPQLTANQISALTGGSQPEFTGNLYTYLIQKPQYSTSESRKALVRRLREALVKCVPIIGVCKPIEAVFSIDAAERPEDKDYSCSRYVSHHSCE